MCYNVPTDPYEEEAFTCKIIATSKNIDSGFVDFCCRYELTMTEYGNRRFINQSQYSLKHILVKHYKTIL